MQDQKIIELIRLDKNDQALLALYKNFPVVKKMIRLKPLPNKQGVLGKTGAVR